MWYERINFILLALLIALLAACDNQGGGGTISGGPVATIDAGSLTDPSLLLEGAFAMQVTGALDLLISSSEAAILPGEATTFPVNLIEMGDSNSGYFLRIGYSGELISGTHPISGEIGLERTQEGIFTAAFVYSGRPDPNAQFFGSPQGTVTLENDGLYIKGTFEISITGSEAGKTITVKGAFNRIPLPNVGA